MVDKVVTADLFAIASVASAAVGVGTPVDVSTLLEADVRIRMGRGTGSAFGVGPIARLEVSGKSSPDADDWTVVAQFQPSLGTSLGSQAVSGTEAAGQTVVSLAAGTNFAKDDYVFFDNGTPANSEWSRVLSVSGANLTLEEGIVNAQTGATCRDQAEQYHAIVNLASIQKMRLVVVGDTTQLSWWHADYSGVEVL